MTAIRPMLLGMACALLLACSASKAPGTPPDAAVPDFTGVWMAFAVEDPDGGSPNAPRYSPEGIARLDAFAAQYRSIPETGKWCLGLGMPSVMMSLVSYPIEIVQTPKQLVMLAELEMQVRRVHLDGRPHDPDGLPSSAGHSIGTWQGDTLVIDTTNLSEWEVRPWPRSADAHIVERVYMTKRDQVKAQTAPFIEANMRDTLNDDVLVFEMTLTDPGYYAGPQRRNTYFQRVDDSQTLEYLCATEHWMDALEQQRIKN